MASWIGTVHRIIPAIRKHIVTQEALASRSEGICVDKSADAGIVITALEVVEPGFSGIAVAVLVLAAIL